MAATTTSTTTPEAEITAAEEPAAAVVGGDPCALYATGKWLANGHLVYHGKATKKAGVAFPATTVSGLYEWRPISVHRNPNPAAAAGTKDADGRPPRPPPSAVNGNGETAGNYGGDATTINFSYFYAYDDGYHTSKERCKRNGGLHMRLARLTAGAWVAFQCDAGVVEFGREAWRAKLFGIRFAAATYHHPVQQRAEPEVASPLSRAMQKAEVAGRGSKLGVSKAALRKTALGRFWKCPVIDITGPLPARVLDVVQPDMIIADYLYPMVLRRPGIHEARVHSGQDYCQTKDGQWTRFVGSERVRAGV